MKAETDKNIVMPQNKNMLSKRILLSVFFLLAGIFIGRYVIPAAKLPVSTVNFVSVENGERKLVYPTFWEAWDKLHANFIGELDDQKLFYGAISGLVNAAGDPYTVFTPPKETKQFEENITGSFSGAGMEIGIRNGVITVISPLADSPAERAGIREGDVILKIGDDPITQDTTLDEAVQKIRGPIGQPIKLSIFHKNSSEPETVTIVRDIIEIESVSLGINENNIAHITVKSFNGDTSKQFLNIAKEVSRQNVSGLILDLRNNPGGFLEAAVDIASRFLSEDTIVVIEKGVTEKKHCAEGKNILAGIPLVVLVNEGSASASEILAGALNDQLKVPIIGTKTFGKGSVQEFIKLNDGSSMKITVAKWYTPNGRSINEEGIEPTIMVEQKHDTEEDEPLTRAFQELESQQ